MTSMFANCVYEAPNTARLCEIQAIVTAEREEYDVLITLRRDIYLVVDSTSAAHPKKSFPVIV
jgi:hypothetical protein